MHSSVVPENAGAGNGLLNPVTPIQGGTGLTGYAAGDILYASATDTLSKLPVGSNGAVLKLAAGLPAWGTDLGITQLTGDGTAAGVGSQAFTLATVNSNVGSFTNASLTVNAKGLITAAANGATPEVPLTFSTGLTRTTNTVTVNTSQNIISLSNLTTNGFIKTGSGNGTLGIDTSTYITGNQTVTLSGDVTGSGATSITTSISGLAYSKLAAMSTGQVLLGNAGTPTATTLSGDVTVGATGVTAIGATKVTNAMLAGSIDMATKMTGTLQAAQSPAFTGDVTTTAGSLTTTLAATSNSTLTSLDKSTGVAIHGTNTNNAAASGYVGETVYGSLARASATSLTTSVAKTVISISVPAGDWHIVGGVGFFFATGTNVTVRVAAASLTTNTIPALSTYMNPSANESSIELDSTSTIPTGDYGVPFPSYRASFSTTTTLFLIAYATFTVSTTTAYGYILATRMR